MHYLIGSILLGILVIGGGFFFGLKGCSNMIDNKVLFEIGGIEYSKRDIEIIFAQKREMESNIANFNNKLESYTSTLKNDPKLNEHLSKIELLGKTLSEYSSRNIGLEGDTKRLKYEIEGLKAEKTALENRIFQFEKNLPQYYQNARLMLE